MTKHSRSFHIGRTVLGVVLALATAAASAEKPSWAGEGKHKEGKNHRLERGQGDWVVFSFSAHDRQMVSEYYAGRAGKGRCPPGLAKKNNGCQAPGHAKQWQKGRPLARDIPYYDVPRELRLRLPVPPPNHRYVRVAGDILMIAVGTGMVVDAIEDILR